MHRKQLRILALYNGIFIFAANLLVPLYTIYMQQFQNSVFSVSLVWSVSLLSTTFFTLIVAKYGHRVRQKEHLLLAGYLVRAAVWISFIFIQSLPALLAMQVILGLGEALGSPAFDALFAERISPENRITQYSKLKLLSNVMTAGGTLLGGSIVAWVGFLPLFGIMAALAIVSFIGVLFTRVPELAPALQPVEA